MQVNPEIFKAYDIRGVYPADVNEQVAYAMGRALITYLTVSEMIVGRDMRLSSPVLFDGLARGLMDQGANVIDIGMVSTDQFYFACSKYNLPGTMITASHNPKEYGGFKIVRQVPYLLSGGEGIQELRRIIEMDSFEAVSNKGSMRTIAVAEQFVDTILSLIDIGKIKRLKVVVDTSNGMVGPILQKVYARLPIDLVGMFLEPDGTFPNHGPDPLQLENRRSLQSRVIEEQADVGFVFDGDGDRVFAIDNLGGYVPGDFLTVLLAKHLLKKRPGSKIIYDMGTSWAVPTFVQDAGGIPLMERVGHTFIKRRMADERALFAGDRAGHYYFQDFNYADSGLIAALFTLELLSQTNLSMSELLSPLYSTYFISGEINSKVTDASTVLQKLVEHFKDGKVQRLDGISISYPTWHFTVRNSNTEPLLRLNLEAFSQEEMENRRDEILNIIRGQ